MLITILACAAIAMCVCAIAAAWGTVRAGGVTLLASVAAGMAVADGLLHRDPGGVAALVPTSAALLLVALVARRRERRARIAEHRAICPECGGEDGD